jgi:hypothetical protein
MRNGLIGLVGPMVLILTVGIAACSSGGTGSTTSTEGGSSSSGGNAPSIGGQQSMGGSASGGGAAIGGSGASMGGSSAVDSAVTNLPGTKVLSALTTDEATQLCKDTYAYFGKAISPATTCKWKGVYFATQSSAPTEEKLRQNCTSKETPCLADPGATWATPNCPDPPSSDCTATIADYSTCIRDQAAAFIQNVSTLPGCDAFTSAYWTPVWNILSADQPVSCQFCDGWYPADPRNP